MIPYGDYLSDDFKSMTIDDFLDALKGDRGQFLAGFTTRQGVSAQRMALILLDFLQSDRFREEVNRRVQPPTGAELETEFIERSNAEITTILEARFRT